MWICKFFASSFLFRLNLENIYRELRHIFVIKNISTWNDFTNSPEYIKEFCYKVTNHVASCENLEDAIFGYQSSYAETKPFSVTEQGLKEISESEKWIESKKKKRKGPPRRKNSVVERVKQLREQYSHKRWWGTSRNSIWRRVPIVQNPQGHREAAGLSRQLPKEGNKTRKL